LIAILGSGFGLYGYLPAFAQARSEDIILPERYRARFAARAELAGFAGRVRWSADEMGALQRATTVVLAKRPADQVALVSQCLVQNSIERLLLEKPLAPTPDAAETLFDQLTSSGRIFRIGYTFRGTAWATSLARHLKTQSGGTLSIRWRFMAHHFANDLQNWKRFHDQGGGAIRFYGIQVIALLAELGYHDVAASQSSGAAAYEVDRWTATFTGNALPDCDVIVDSRSEVTELHVARRGTDGVSRVLVAQRDPFSATATEGLDPRVGLLRELCASLWSDDAAVPWYAAANALWREVEAQTVFAVS
jgi:predicted dehydrogenase